MSCENEAPTPIYAVDLRTAYDALNLLQGRLHCLADKNERTVALTVGLVDAQALVARSLELVEQGRTPEDALAAAASEPQRLDVSRVG